MSGLLATTLAATFAIATIAPLNAAPIFVRKGDMVHSDVLTVRDGRNWRHTVRRSDRRQEFRHDDNNSYYNGHRGYRQYHRGYRQHNGIWFPAAAFITGAIIGGALNQAGSGGRSGDRNAHVQWCYDHYKSYRASSNTYQPYSGSRRVCNSPYN